MLERVAATLTDRQRRVFELSTLQHLRGRALAAALKVSEKEANDLTYENRIRVERGFGALVLARDGRRYCAGLARILDTAGWSGQDEAFTRVLRLRILKHLDKCQTCDNCQTCKDSKLRLITPYAPIVIPILIAMDLHDRITHTIRQVSDQAPIPASSPRPPHDGAPPRPASGLTAPGRPRRARRIARSPVLPLVLVLVLLLIGGGIWLGRHGQRHLQATPTARPAAAVSELAFATPSGIDISTVPGTTRQVAAIPAGRSVNSLFWSPDGRQLAWTTGTTTTGTDTTQVLEVKTGTTWSCRCSAFGVQTGGLISEDPTDPPNTPAPDRKITTSAGRAVANPGR
jgi:hypothetical protein